MNNPLISVIVPVYKTEDYLNKCITSIINQTYRNLEIILVDDGSPDNCPQICDNWTNKDNRIIVVHKKNGGLSDARNTGIKISTGKYLIFIDSDDYWLENDFLENSVNILNETKDKILIFGYGKVNSNGEFKPEMNFSSCKTSSCNSEFCFNNGYIISSACTKIIEKSFIIDNDIYFRCNVHSEDIEWTAKIIALNDSYSIYPKNIYAYFQNENSITHSITEKDVLMLIDNIDRCIDIAENYKLADEISFYNYVAYQYITALNVYVLYAKTKDVKKRLNKYKYLLKYNANKKVKLVYLFNTLFGFTMMTKILYVFLKLRKLGR